MHRILFLLILTFLIGNINSQNIKPEVISSAGETFIGTSSSIEWTLGETAITTIQNINNIVTQGFHQPAQNTTKIQKPAENGIIEVFPNPASDWIELNIDFKKYSNVQIQLIDINGKLIWEKMVEGTKVTDKISINKLINGTYFLKFIIEENHFSKTFKIQKVI